MRQRGIVAQLAVLVARNVIGRADGREHFRLFHGVDAEVGFEIEIQVQHVFRIAGLLYHQRENAFLDGIASGDLRRCRRGRRFLSDHRACRRGGFDFFLRCRRGRGQVRPLLIHETDHVRQRGIVAQLAVLVARNVIRRADGREHFRLFHGVDAEVGFEIEIQIQHVFRIAGLLYDQRENAFLDGIASGDLRRCAAGAGFSATTAVFGVVEFDFFLRCLPGLQPGRAASHTRSG